MKKSICNCYGCEAYREGTMKVDIEDVAATVKSICTNCFGEMFRPVLGTTLCYECVDGKPKGFHDIERPAHYNSHPSGIEAIEITQHMNFCLGNAIKYIWRASLKNGLEDLKKAKWYINREIERLEKE